MPSESLVLSAMMTATADAGIKSPVYNTLFARVNSKGVLADATVIRVAPDAKKIIIMPGFSVHSERKPDNA